MTSSEMKLPPSKPAKPFKAQTKMCITRPNHLQEQPIFASIHKPHKTSIAKNVSEVVNTMGVDSERKNYKNTAAMRKANPVRCDMKIRKIHQRPIVVPISNNLQNQPLQPLYDSIKWENEGKQHSRQPQQRQKNQPSEMVDSKRESQLQFAAQNVQHQPLSRIPTSVHGFNRISQPMPNAWNSIYERHLLSQTMFERPTDDILANKRTTTIRKNGITGVTDTQRSGTDFNFNNNVYHNELQTALSMAIPNNVRETNSSALSSMRNIDQFSCEEKFVQKKSVKFRPLNHSSMPYVNNSIQLKSGDFSANETVLPIEKSSNDKSNNSAMAIVDAKNLYKPKSNLMGERISYADANDESISGKMCFVYDQPSVIEKNTFIDTMAYNGHNKQFNRKVSINDCQLNKCIGVLWNQAYGGNSKNKCLERGPPVGGNQCEDTSQSTSKANAMGTMTTTTTPMPAPSTSLSLISAVNAKVISNTFTNAITTSGGESTAATNCEYTSNSKINIMLETAQAMAAAAYFARAAQRMANSNAPMKPRVPDVSNAERGGFCGALQRTSPPMPAGLAKRLANKENYGLGKVKVMLRISDSALTDGTQAHYLSIDKKKRQITLTDPTTSAQNPAASERGPKVAAPKIFAFDNLFTDEDAQTDITSSALSEVIPAVLEGTDACLLTLGYSESGQSQTMLGSLAPAKLGAIPCATAWLYKGINERRQKTGARFSVRVSALSVNATKPGSTSRDLLAGHATEEDSPSVYLRDDYLGGPTELRAPTAERAALFLDSALAARHQSSSEPALIFTLHVYQYSLAGKGGVAGGRSRLHLINIGGCANRSGGFPLSGIGNTLFAILGGQKHTPNQTHPLTPLLKDCLAPITCHVTILAHISCKQSHTDVLTTVQVASRIHRMRRRKHRLPLSTQKALGFDITGNFSGSSDGPDPSSSDLSADTVIYLGPSDDATDGEHPPVYIPSMNSGDNRCSMNKALKGSGIEKPSKLPQKKITKPQSPVPHQRTDSLKRRLAANSNAMSCEKTADLIPLYQYNHSSLAPQTSVSLPNSPKIIPSARHIQSPKGSPLRRANNSNHGSPKRQMAEEQWIDGPRLSKLKVAEARHLMREINHVKKCETWIDGPNMSPSKSLAAGSLPTSNTQAYGYMDTHKKIMIRQWVENQTNQVFSNAATSTTTTIQMKTLPLPTVKNNSDDEEICIETTLNEITESLCGSKELNTIDGHKRVSIPRTSRENVSEHCENESARSAISSHRHNECQEDEDQDSGPSEIPPALPLIEPLSSREISHESIHIMCSRHVSREGLHTQTIDCGLQVTEEEIAREMGRYDNLHSTNSVDKFTSNFNEHPLSALSQANMSVISSFNVGGVGDAFSDCFIGEHTRHQFDQLAQLRDLYTSQLAMAEVTPNYKINHAGSVYSEPAFRLISGPGSVCSEPPYRAPSPRCNNCRQSMSMSRTPSQSSLPSLNCFVTNTMDQYASLRHPDGASDPNIEQKTEKISSNIDSKIAELLNEPPKIELIDHKIISTHVKPPIVSQSQIPQLPPLSLSTPEAYDSGHDSSTPRTSKHSGISRRAESGYHSVATARDGDDSSFGSGVSPAAQRIAIKKRNRQEKSLCNWLKNPFTCTQPDTEGEISDF